MKKFLWTVLVITSVSGFSYWAYVRLSRPLPGEAVADLGREHIAVGTAGEYNSNPPTSGPHYAEWTRAGIYDQPIEDGYLVHSLEHGYVIFSFRDEGLKDELVKLFEDLNGWKLIVVRRPELDVPLALTAWGRILKLETVDERQIRDFVSTFRNTGPERTME